MSNLSKQILQRQPSSQHVIYFWWGWLS